MAPLDYLKKEVVPSNRLGMIDPTFKKGFFPEQEEGAKN
jgi:hypothetical protein